MLIFVRYNSDRSKGKDKSFEPKKPIHIFHIISARISQNLLGLLLFFGGVFRKILNPAFLRPYIFRQRGHKHRETPYFIGLWRHRRAPGSGRIHSKVNGICFQNINKLFFFMTNSAHICTVYFRQKQRERQKLRTKKAYSYFSYNISPVSQNLLGLLLFSGVKKTPGPQPGCFFSLLFLRGASSRNYFPHSQFTFSAAAAASSCRSPSARG